MKLKKNFILLSLLQFLLLLHLCSSLYANPVKETNDEKIRDEILKILPQKTGVSFTIRIANSIVYLEGKVASDDEAGVFMAKVAKLPKVKAININKLINPEGIQPSNDAIINVLVAGTYVMSGLFGDIDMASLPVFVKTYHGIVYLTGIVNNHDQRIAIIKLALPIPGVTRVISTAHLSAVSVSVSY